MTRAPTEPDALTALDAAHLWHPFTPQGGWDDAEALVIERGEGAYLVDAAGRRYLDAVGSLWCNVHGHRHPAIDAAIVDQLGRLAHSTLLGLTHPTAVRLARRLVELAPAGLTRVVFSGDGASAVEAGLKLAFQFWQQAEPARPRRTRFVALDSAYHGDTVGAVSVGGVDRFHAMFSPLLFDAIRVPAPYCYRCPLGLDRRACATECLDAVDRVLAAHGEEVAALIVEPLVQGAGGIIVQPPGYLAGLREITRRRDVLLIADEVAVGFGKTGALFATGREGVEPDILCLGKGLTGGYLPMAATLTTERVHAAFVGTPDDPRTFQHGHTFAGNPLAAAAALASLDVFDAERTLAGVAEKSAHLAARLAPLGDHRHVGEVRQCGLIAGVELVADRASKAPFPPSRRFAAGVCRRARGLGVLLRPIGDVLILMPPLSITAGELDAIVGAISESLAAESGDAAA